MLTITVPGRELWDGSKGEFLYTKPQILVLEHSLVSLSKWESKWCKPFISNEKKTYEETIDYIRCMTLTQNISPDVYNNLTQDNVSAIVAYIDAPMTATKIPDAKGRKANREKITSELIYYWMSALNIPLDCQKWHLNRLITYIRVCNAKNKPKKSKRSSNPDQIARNAELNRQRLAKYRTKG